MTLLAPEGAGVGPVEDASVGGCTMEAEVVAGSHTGLALDVPGAHVGADAGQSEEW